MAEITTQAEQHEPTGDSEHVAYGKNYYYRCSCGHTSRFLTTQNKATYRAEQHEEYCDGETTVEVSL